MKKLLSCFFALITVNLVFAQTVINDPLVEKRTVTGFHGIEVATGIQLILTAGNTEELAVSASTVEFRDKIVSKVENGILKLHYESKPGAINKTHEKKDLKAYVSYKNLDMLEATTGAEVQVDGVLTTSSLKINANTGSRINGKINSTDLKVNQNTGSFVTITGQAEKLEVEGDTGSKFQGEDFEASVCDLKVSTGARIWVTATRELTAKANTGGNIKYKGAPSQKHIRKNTGGTVSKI